MDPWNKILASYFIIIGKGWSTINLGGALIKVI